MKLVNVFLNILTGLKKIITHKSKDKEKNGYKF